MEDTWLFLIGLGKLPTNFPRQPRSHLDINHVVIYIALIL